ncbi:hypothetical protein EPU35_25285, partial [Escherichia coli]
MTVSSPGDRGRCCSRRQGGCLLLRAASCPASWGASQPYTYLYPGLRQITQAAGRVIRDEQDQGFVYLLD